MSTPLWGEREPLARARGDRRTPGRSFTPSPLSIGGGVGWGGGVVDRLQPLIFQRSYAMVPHRVHRVPSLYGLDKFAPPPVWPCMPVLRPLVWAFILCQWRGPVLAYNGRVWCMVLCGRVSGGGAGGSFPMLCFSLLVLCPCFVSSGCRGLFWPLSGCLHGKPPGLFWCCPGPSFLLPYYHTIKACWFAFRSNSNVSEAFLKKD